MIADDLLADVGIHGHKDYELGNQVLRGLRLPTSWIMFELTANSFEAITRNQSKENCLVQSGCRKRGSWLKQILST